VTYGGSLRNRRIPNALVKSDFNSTTQCERPDTETGISGVDAHCPGARPDNLIGSSKKEWHNLSYYQRRIPGVGDAQRRVEPLEVSSKFTFQKCQCRPALLPEELKVKLMEETKSAIPASTSVTLIKPSIY
jgi:hypothetical protein